MSRALALGETLPAIGKRLGHTQVQTTAYDTMKAPAARIGDSIGNDLVTVSQAAFISTDYTYIEVGACYLGRMPCPP